MPQGKPPESADKVFEKKLLESVSKTRSVFTFIKFFGIDFLVYISLFVAGLNKESPQWMIPAIVFFIIKDIWTTIRDNNRFEKIIKTLRDDEKPLVLADAKRLPPWVYFPDVERCSWLNKLITHFWPYISKTVTEKIQALASDMKVSGLKLRKVSLGTVPPIITGMKVFDKKVSNSRLIMDADLCYSGDSKISISYLCIPAGIDNFQLRGPARLDFLIINELPFIGGVEFSFLGLPDIDFALTGIGSLGCIEETVRSVINSKISSLAVFPRKVGSTWAAGSEETMPDPKGVIRLHVIEAMEVENLDNCLGGLFGGGASDPYAEVSYGKRTFWSKVIDNCAEPRWDFWCEFVKGSGKAVTIKVMDKDPHTPDELVGTYTLKVSDIEERGKIESWVDILREGKRRGSIHIQAFFLQLSPDVKHVNLPPEELSFLSSYVLTVLVKSAQNLMVPHSEKRPSSIVKLTVGNDTQETKMIENNHNPAFGEFFTFMVNNPDCNKLKVKVVDGEVDSEIGSFSYSLKKLLDRKDLEIVDQHFPLLDSATESTVVLSIRLRAIENVFF